MAPGDRRQASQGQALRQAFSWKGVVARSVLGFAALFLASTSLASVPGDGLRFHHYSQDDGLVQNTVQAIVQDRYGFIWIGTEDGLHRFDGYEMLVYQAEPGQANGLQADGVQSLLANGGDVWIGTYGGGISRLDIESGRFTHFRHLPDNSTSLQSDYIFGLALNPDGRIWVLTDKGLDLLDPETGQVTRFGGDTDSGLTSHEIWSMHVDSEGTMWAGAVDGLFVFDAATNRFELFRADDPRYDPFHDHTITAIAETREGHLLLGTLAGLHRLDEKRDLVETRDVTTFGLPADASLYLRRILATSTGEIWAASYDSGVYWWDEATDRFRNYRHDPADVWSLSDDVVLSLFEDRTGVIWFGTQTGGINKFNHATRAFRHYRHQKNQPNTLPNRVVWAILEDRAGDLWIGTDGGVSRLDRERGKYTHYLHDPADESSLSTPNVTAILEDSRGRIWIGTYYGINLLDTRSGTFRRYILNTGADDAVYANSVSFLFEDAGYIWAGTAEGLYRLDPGTGNYQRVDEFHDSTNPADSVFVTAAPANAGGWWLGTENDLLHFNAQTQAFTAPVPAEGETLSHPSVFDILETPDGTLWIGTDYKLNRVSPAGEVTHIGVEQGLPSNTIYSMEADGKGRLWVATNAGLAVYDPADGSVHVHDTTDGLQSNEFNSGASYRAPSGELFFGGINGFNAFYPEDVIYDARPPSVAITKFFKFNQEFALDQPISSLKGLALNWRDTVIGFEFAVFDFAAPDKNRFRYQLEGFDRQWLEATGHHHVTYTNLDPGDYVLHVQGANHRGVWSENEVSLHVDIAPPPWRTWWAYALYVLIVLTAFTAALRFHFVRLAEKHQLENAQQKRRWAETLQQLTQALASSLDGREVAEELLENLRAMVGFRKAVLFVEQGIEIHVAGAKGMRDDQVKKLDNMPTEHSRFFAEVRHGRKPRIFTRQDIDAPALQDDMSTGAQFLAVPAYSRADEFALLVIGRDTPPFSEQERDIVSAFLTQALVAIDNARLFAEVQNLATTDALTQVHNRRYFFELAELEFARSRRYDRDVSLILLDADNFKSINDNYGREIGDRVLKIVASCCRNGLRHFDIIGRYGGEDFIIMLPETPMNIAADVADRLRKSIESVHVDTHKGELAVTVSVGVAIATENTPDLPALINRADMALYEAKRAGRNKVVVAER